MSRLGHRRPREYYIWEEDISRSSSQHHYHATDHFEPLSREYPATWRQDMPVPSVENEQSQLDNMAVDRMEELSDDQLLNTQAGLEEVLEREAKVSVLIRLS